MKIYNYDKLSTRYGRLTMISDEIPINLIRMNRHIILVLSKNIFQNRPFKQILYALRTKYNANFIQQDIIINNRYFSKRKEYIDNLKDEILNSKCKFIYSKMDLLRIYKILNHFIHKNNKK